MFPAIEHPLLVAGHSAMAQPLLRLALAAAALSPLGGYRKHRAVRASLFLRTSPLSQLRGPAANVRDQRAVRSSCRRRSHVGLRIDHLPDPSPGHHAAAALAKQTADGDAGRS